MTLYQRICNSQKAYLIAEAGVNHNGDIELAYRLIDAATASGADAVKFQTFKTENIITRDAPLADYQRTKGLPSQFEMAKALELPFEKFAELKRYAEKKNIQFLSTPDDEESLEYLCALDMDVIKIGSGEITNHPFLQRIGRTGRAVILSTGMSSLSEVTEAVRVIQDTGNHQIILLHCVSQYPAPVDQVNLRAMDTLRTHLNLPVGFSDHTLGIHVALAAAARGALVIEKHLTLDKKLAGPDHACSLEPSEMTLLAEGIQEIAMAMGTGEKKPSRGELDNRRVVRRSLVAKKDLKAGEKLAREHLAVKRPGFGISPKFLNTVMGLTVKRDIPADTLLDWEMFDGN